jgi:hypothetical protein
MLADTTTELNTTIAVTSFHFEPFNLGDYKVTVTATHDVLSPERISCLVSLAAIDHIMQVWLNYNPRWV